MRHMFQHSQTIYNVQYNNLLYCYLCSFSIWKLDKNNLKSIFTLTNHKA